MIAFETSPASRFAARIAVDLAAHDEGSVFFARITTADHDAQEAPAFTEAAADASSSGVASDAAVLSGNPIDAILDSAATWHADLIVIGTDGRWEHVSRVASAAEAVVRTSVVPVLVVYAGAVMAAPNPVSDVSALT